ncbi:MAG: DUF6065 family protein [Planctomycetota bacterium]
MSSDRDALELSPHVTAYTVGPSDGWSIEPPSPRRTWMDDTEGFAYRCLPLVMANQAGWVIRCPVGFDAVWNGGTSLKDTSITLHDGGEGFEGQITSHFGWGIITFSLPWLFQTTRGYGMLVRGPTNSFVVNCAPLDGFVETDWLAATFTMNWKIVEPDRVVRFQPNAPICHIIPFPIEILERTTPKLRSIDDNPQFKEQYEAWSHSRTSFNARPDRTPDEWQKDYLRGQSATGQPAHAHRTRLNLRRFSE